ncbi:hypothetical protein KAU11_05315 [Candidatus Babeliales bacterium]|nr:hypothetical protein [Candidatus Babeliales bacterium]
MRKKSQDWWSQQKKKMIQQVQELHALVDKLKLEDDPISRAACDTIRMQLEKVNADLRSHLRYHPTDKKDINDIWS